MAINYRINAERIRDGKKQAHIIFSLGVNDKIEDFYRMVRVFKILEQKHNVTWEFFGRKEYEKSAFIYYPIEKDTSYIHSIINDVIQHL